MTPTKKRHRKAKPDTKVDDPDTKAYVTPIKKRHRKAKLDTKVDDPDTKAYVPPDMMSHTRPILSVDEELSLIERSKSGDNDAFATLIKAHEYKVFSICYGFVHNREDALDLAQDIFIKAYRYIDRFDVTMRLYPWLNTITRNHCLNHIKRNSKTWFNSIEALEEDDNIQIPSDIPTQTDIVSNEETRTAIWRSMDLLHPRFREIIVMKYFHNLSYKEMANTIGIPIGTIMSRLFNARKALGVVMVEHFKTVAEEQGHSDKSITRANKKR